MAPLPDEWPRHLGDLILLEMSNRSWSRNKVADHLGVDTTTVKNWILGRGRPRGNSVTLIARFVGIDMATAFTLNYQPQRHLVLEADDRIKDLEAHVSFLALELRDLRAQVQAGNDSLVLLMERVKAARGRTRS